MDVRSLRPRPHESENFESLILFTRINLQSTRNQWIRSPKPHLFLNCSPEWFNLGAVHTKERKWPNENNLCITPKWKWRKVCPLQQRFLQEIQVAGYVVVLMRVAMCLEYSTRPAYLKICIQKFINYTTILLYLWYKNFWRRYEVSSVM